MRGEENGVASNPERALRYCQWPMGSFKLAYSGVQVFDLLRIRHFDKTW
jgi:hypothetical protein